MNIAPCDDPSRIVGLVPSARLEGFRFLDRLVAEWEDGSNRFLEEGEVFFVVTLDERVVACGGVTRQSVTVGRLRRVYVHPDFRALGIGGRLVRALNEHAQTHFKEIVLRAAGRDAARLYERVGFVPEDPTGPDRATHRLIFDPNREQPHAEHRSQAGMPYDDLRERFQTFLKGLPDGKVVVLADGDVDGLGAACVVWDALGAREKTFLTPPKGRNAFGDETAALVTAQDPAVLFVLDLGVSPRVIAPGVPTLLLDHHHPRGEPKGATVLTGYGLDPVPTSSLLAWKVAGAPENAWKANVGNQGDLGPSDPELDDERAGGTKRAFDMAKSLLNSAKRSSDPDQAVPAAFRVLSAADSPKAVVEATGPDAEILKHFADEVKRELNEAKKNGPRFSKSEPLALIRFSSPARVHPLIAQSWRGRLPKYAIVAANDGYVPGRTNFSMRASVGIDLLAILAKYGERLGIDEPEYGHGHHAATGGSLPTETFERLIAAMGF